MRKITMRTWFFCALLFFLGLNRLVEADDKRDFYARNAVSNANVAEMTLNGFPIYKITPGESGETGSKWITCNLKNGTNTISAKLGDMADRDRVSQMRVEIRSSRHGQKRVPENDRVLFRKTAVFSDLSVLAWPFSGVDVIKGVIPKDRKEFVAFNTEGARGRQDLTCRVNGGYVFALPEEVTVVNPTSDMKKVTVSFFCSKSKKKISFSVPDLVQGEKQTFALKESSIVGGKEFFKWDGFDSFSITGESGAEPLKVKRIRLEKFRYLIYTWNFEVKGVPVYSWQNGKKVAELIKPKSETRKQLLEMVTQTHKAVADNNISERIRIFERCMEDTAKAQFRAKEDYVKEQKQVYRESKFTLLPLREKDIRFRVTNDRVVKVVYADGKNVLESKPWKDKTWGTMRMSRPLHFAYIDGKWVVCGPPL